MMKKLAFFFCMILVLGFAFAEKNTSPFGGIKHVPQTGFAVLPVNQSLHDNFLNSKTRAAALDQELKDRRNSFNAIQQQFSTASSGERTRILNTLDGARAQLLESAFNKLVAVQAQVFSSIQNSKQWAEKISTLSSSKTLSPEFSQKFSDFQRAQSELESKSVELNNLLQSMENNSIAAENLKQVSSEIRSEIGNLKAIFKAGKILAQELLKK